MNTRPDLDHGAPSAKSRFSLDAELDFKLQPLVPRSLSPPPITHPPSDWQLELSENQSSHPFRARTVHALR
eukprot:813381-Rhodomonas_salina.1